MFWQPRAAHSRHPTAMSDGQQWLLFLLYFHLHMYHTWSCLLFFFLLPADRSIKYLKSTPFSNIYFILSQTFTLINEFVLTTCQFLYELIHNEKICQIHMVVWEDKRFV